MSGSEKPVSVLFVCLGNICRSPMAEGVFQHLIKSADKGNDMISRIDSAGTGAYHIGEDPDPRTMSTLVDRNIKDYKHKARKFVASDFTSFDYILAMDNQNLRHLNMMRKQALKEGLPDEMGKVMLFGDFGGKSGEEVVDPYYGARDGFETAYEQMVRFTEGFLEMLKRRSSQ